MAKKLWVGLGIGCGALVLLAAVGIGVSAWWVKSHLSGMTGSVKQMKAQKAELDELDKQYPFDANTAPPLTEARLDEYVAIRAPALQDFQKLQAELDALNQKKKDEMSFSEAMAAGQDAMVEAAHVRQLYVDGLKSHQMSADEFEAITRMAYGSDAQGANSALFSQAEPKLKPLRSRGLDELLTSDNPGKAIQHELQPKR
jgi:hypothetical protein